MASHPAAQGEAEECRQIRGGRMTGRHSWRVARSGCLPLPQNVILKTSVINTCLQTVRIDRRGTLMKHVWPLWHHNGISGEGEGISLLRCEAFIERTHNHCYTETSVEWVLHHIGSVTRLATCLWWRVSVVQHRSDGEEVRFSCFLLCSIFSQGNPPNTLFCHQTNEIEPNQNKQNWPFHFTLETYEKGQSLAHPQCLEMLFLKQK